MWTHLVRQTASGGSSPIGTRGPGETQLETDRRHIRRKIRNLEESLKDVRRVRDTQRRLREKNAFPVVALIGYTNAGKSTLLNCLTGSDIPANDRLFDTLDTTTRRLRLNDQQEILLSDTVGFIRKLPTHLVEAFKATLEELKYADVLLHVIDLSNPEWDVQAEIVENLVRQLGAEATPCLRVYNKCDRYFGILPHGDDVVCVSAKSGEGCDHLIEKLGRMLADSTREAELILPWSDAGLVDGLKQNGQLRELHYEENGIRVLALLDSENFGRLKKYIPGYTEPAEEWE